MATSHSLPSSSQRSGTQLPFSPSQSNATSRLPGTVARSHSGSISSNVASSRPSSIVTSGLRPLQSVGEAGQPALPQSVSIPLLQPRPMHTSTHVSGILPSASFFHPSRPSYPPPSPSSPHARRGSLASIVSSEAPASDVLHLTTLSERHSQASDGTSTSEHSIKDGKDTAAKSRAPTAKPSREPLLPIGPRPARRPSLNTAQLTPYGTHDASLSPSGRVRDSFEKLFKRGMSTDGSRQSPSRTSHVSPIEMPSQTPAGLRSFEASPTSPTAAPRIPFELGASGHRKSSSSHSFLRSSPSPTPSFIPAPPPGAYPPRAFTPAVDASTGKPMRNWQNYPSRNHFFLAGHMLTGGDAPWAFVASLAVVLGITGVWFGTTCVWWWKHESPAVAAVGAYMCLLTISSMFATAFRDPGILPRNLDPDPPCPTAVSTESLRGPLPRDIKVRRGVVRTKYCQTCRTYRPPRASHCKMCDNCVDGCDHHCQWVNNCIGRRNYTTFFTFLFSAVLTLVLVICTSAIQLYLLTRAPFHLNFRHALQTTEGAGGAAAFVMSILVIWPVMALLLYHTRLLLLNVTTIEQIRNQAHKSLGQGPAPPNPFSHGSWKRNLVYVLCRPAGFSWIEAAAMATEDGRDVNPGLLRDAEGSAEDGWLGAAEEGRAGRKGE